MVFEPNEKLKKKMEKNGSVLQYMYSVAGAGKGVIAVGGMLAGIGILLAAALSGTIGTEGAVKLAVVMIVPGILLILLGIFLQHKRERAWIAAYMKETGFKEQELHQIDEEFRQPGTVLLAFYKGKDTNSLKRMGFITANYIKLPAVKPFIYRLDDMVACFYTKKLLCRDGGYDDALIAYPLDAEQGFAITEPPEKASLEIVKAVKERNPKVITDHHFAYEGKEYDAAAEMDQVIELHKRVYGRQ